MTSFLPNGLMIINKMVIKVQKIKRNFNELKIMILKQNECFFFLLIKEGEINNIYIY